MYCVHGCKIVGEACTEIVYNRGKRMGAAGAKGVRVGG